MGLTKNINILSNNNIVELHPKKDFVFKPGIYDISNDEYHLSNGLSRTGLMLYKRSPLHYADRYIKGNVPKESKSLAMGKAVHTYILEPNKFSDIYFVSEKLDRRTKEGKERHAQILKEHAHKTILQQDEFDLIESLGNSILKHDTASLFLKDAQVERSIFWNDCTTNVMLKCRPDILLTNILADVKTTDDASYKEFQRDVFKYGYHIQAAMMQDGIYHILRKKIETFVFIAVEKKPPYAVAIYDIDKAIIDLGREEYKEVLKHFRDTQEKQEWSGYKTQTIMLPAYYS